MKGERIAVVGIDDKGDMSVKSDGRIDFLSACSKNALQTAQRICQFLVRHHQSSQIWEGGEATVTLSMQPPFVVDDFKERVMRSVDKNGSVTRSDISARRIDQNWARCWRQNNSERRCPTILVLSSAVVAAKSLGHI